MIDPSSTALADDRVWALCSTGRHGFAALLRAWRPHDPEAGAFPCNGAGTISSVMRAQRNLAVGFTPLGGGGRRSGPWPRARFPAFMAIKRWLARPARGRCCCLGRPIRPICAGRWKTLQGRGRTAALRLCSASGAAAERA